LTDWKQKGCPQISRNWWSLKDVLAWRGLVSASGLKSDDDIEKLGLQEQKLIYEIKWKQAQTENITYKNDIEKGKYLEREEIISELRRYFVVLKRSLLILPRKISNELSSYLDAVDVRRLENLIEETITDCLDQMSVSGVYNAKKNSK